MREDEEKDPGTRGMVEKIKGKASELAEKARKGMGRAGEEAKSKARGVKDVAQAKADEARRAVDKPPER